MDPIPPSALPSSANVTRNNEDVSMDYAGFGRRLGANFIDGFILILINLSIGFGLGLGGLNKGGLSSIIGFLIGAGYLIFFWVSQNGQTLGKRAMAIRIVKEDGQPIDFATAIIRYIGYIISSIALFLGFIWVIFDPKKQGWHDKIAKTYVVKTEGKPKTWLAILLVIIYFFIFITAIAFGVVAGLTGAKTAKQNNLRQLNQLMPRLTQNYINQLVGSTFSEVNTWRTSNNLSQFLPDQKLCAYAQRRLEQLSKLEDNYDGARGLYEDTANPDMSRAYFSDYSSMSEMFQTMSSSLKSQEVISAWTGQNSNIRRSDLTHACIQADTKSLIFIGGVKKTK